MTQNAAGLHSYFCNYYRRRYKKEYNPQGRGIETVLLSKLLKNYDYFQVMKALRLYIDRTVMATILFFVNEAPSIIEEYCDDILEARAWIALRSKPTSKLREAYYRYVDAIDCWFPNPNSISSAATKLEQLVDQVIE